MDCEITIISQLFILDYYSFLFSLNEIIVALTFTSSPPWLCAWFRVDFYVFSLRCFRGEAAGETLLLHLNSVTQKDRHKYFHNHKIIQKVNFTFIQLDFAGEKKNNNTLSTLAGYFILNQLLYGIKCHSSSTYWKTGWLETNIWYLELGETCPFF